MDLEAGALLEDLAHQYVSAVGAAVPDHHDRLPSDGTEEMSEERHYLRSSDRLLVDSEVEAIGGGHPADCGEPGPPPLVEQYGSASDKDPGLRGVGDQREPALVDKHHYGASQSGFFFYSAAWNAACSSSIPSGHSRVPDGGGAATRPHGASTSATSRSACTERPSPPR